jgi:hypothetical protein
MTDEILSKLMNKYTIVEEYKEIGKLKGGIR